MVLLGKVGFPSLPAANASNHLWFVMAGLIRGSSPQAEWP